VESVDDCCCSVVEVFEMIAFGFFEALSVGGINAVVKVSMFLLAPQPIVIGWMM
jgi:hypothetical protein